MISDGSEPGAHRGKRPGQPCPIVCCKSQPLRLAEMVERFAILSERDQRLVQFVPDVDGLPSRRYAGRKVLESCERTLEREHSLTIASPPQRLVAGLPEVCERLCPDAGLFEVETEG